MKLKHILLSAGLVAASLTTSVAMAKPHHGEFNLYRFLLSEKAQTKLSLSDDQVAKIEAIAKAEKSNLESLKESHKASRAKFKAIMDAPEFDEMAFKAAFEEGQANRYQAALIKAKSKHQLIHTLEPEQQQQLQDLKQKMKERRKQHMERKHAKSAD